MDAGLGGRAWHGQLGRCSAASSGDGAGGDARVGMTHEDPLLVGGLEHEFYDFPYIGNNDPN